MKGDSVSADEDFKVTEAEFLQDLDERLAQAQDLVRQARELKARHDATDASLRELAEIWADARAQEFREKFDSSRQQAELYLRCAIEYEQFLGRMAQARDMAGGAGDDPSSPQKRRQKKGR